jgi:putative transposase
MASGLMYLTATIDWFSRYVVAWRLSDALDGFFCLGMIDKALSQGRPEVFNTDEAVQLTAEAFTGRPESAGVAVSMDGRGRALDNVCVERRWRAVKYEDISVQGYDEVPDLRRGLAWYFAFSNRSRLHQALGNRAPAEVHAMPVRCDLRLSLPASD